MPERQTRQIFTIRQVFIKTICIMVFSIISSIALTCMIGAIFGFAAWGVAILTATVCPLLITPPVCYTILSQNLRIRTALDELRRVHGILTEQARRDGLTGLLNRSAFMIAAERA